MSQNFTREAINELKRLCKIPRTYADIFLRIAKKLNSPDFIKSIRTYQSKQERISKKIDPRYKYSPYKKSSIGVNDLRVITSENTSYLLQGEEYWMMAESSSPLVKPTLYYYSLTNYCTFFMRTIFQFYRRSHTHGYRLILSSTDMNDLNSAFLRGEKKIGNFHVHKVIDTFAVLGLYSVFESIISDNRIVLDKAWNPYTRNLQLNNLVGFDLMKREKSVAEIHRTWEGVIRISNLIQDKLVLLAASSLSRYNSAVWTKIIEGFESRFYYFVLRAYERFAEHIALIFLSLQRVLNWTPQHTISNELIPPLRPCFFLIPYFEVIL